MTEDEKIALVKAAQTAGASPQADAFHEDVMAFLERNEETPAIEIAPRPMKE